MSSIKTSKLTKKKKQLMTLNADVDDDKEVPKDCQNGER